MKQLTVVLMALLTSHISHRAAQAADELIPGVRIRIKTAKMTEVPVTTIGETGEARTLLKPRKTFVGELVSMDNEVVVVKLEGRETRLSVPISSLQVVEVGM